MTLFVNKIITLEMESLHLQGLEAKSYASPIYDINLSAITENRLSKFNNVSNIIKYISTYYKNIKQDTSAITSYLISTL